MPPLSVLTVCTSRPGQNPMKPDNRRFATIVAVIGVAYVMSQFYRAVFGFLAATVLLALAAYLRLPDARPSAGFAQDWRANAPLS